MRRILIEKKADFDRTGHRTSDLLAYARILSNIREVRLVRVYDLYNCPEDLENSVITQVLCDSVFDNVLEDFPEHYLGIIWEYVPGCCDRQAENAEQRLHALDQRFENTRVLCAEAWLVVLGGMTTGLREAEIGRIRRYLLDPIEKREKDMKARFVPYKSGISQIERYESFLHLTKEELAVWHCEHGLAMSLPDLLMVQKRFQFEGKAPTETDIRMLDTYWTDHCHHTTSNADQEAIQFPNSEFCQMMEHNYRARMLRRKRLGTDDENMKPINISLMDMATDAAEELHELKKIVDVEFADEACACSVQVHIDENGIKKPWLIRFKNKIHNDSTEIKPFSNVVYDQLGKYSHMHEAIRLSKGDQVIKSSLKEYKGRHEESSDAISLMSTFSNIQNREPSCGDIILLIGGATDSLRSQYSVSIYDSNPELQKRDVSDKQKLRRLFSHEIFANKIKRCTDFSIGGVAVAVSELADGVIVDLDEIPVKYHGLSEEEFPTIQLQEHMVIVVAPEDSEFLIALAAYENIAAIPIGIVTEEKRLVMRWKDREIVNLNCEFINTNEVNDVQEKIGISDVDIGKITSYPNDENWREKFKEQLAKSKFTDFRVALDMDVYTLTRNVKTQRTPNEASIYVPLTQEQTPTVSTLAYGSDNLSEKSPYHSGCLAVIDATSRLVAVGGDAMNAHYFLQKYFPTFNKDPQKWEQAVSSVLGANHALYSLNHAVIHCEDSISDSLNELGSSSALVSFTEETNNTHKPLSSEFKAADEYIYWLRCPTDKFLLPQMDIFCRNNNFIKSNVSRLSSVRAVRCGGIIQALYEGTLENNLGVKVQFTDLFKEEYGSYLLTSKKPLPQHPLLQLLGITTAAPELNINDEVLSISELYHIATRGLEKTFIMAPEELPTVENSSLVVFPQEEIKNNAFTVFEKNSTEIDEFVSCRCTVNRSERNAQIFGRRISNLQTRYFRTGNESERFNKFTANIVGYPHIEVTENLLRCDKFTMGVCNMQIRTGTLSFGCVRNIPLYYSMIYKQETAADVVNHYSSWLNKFKMSKVHDMTFSQGEGRCITSFSPPVLDTRYMAFQYANPETPQLTMDSQFNPNSLQAVGEEIISSCKLVMYFECSQLFSCRDSPHLSSSDIVTVAA